MRRYKQKEAYKWNAEIAYIVGLIAADGCLYADMRHINLTSKDVELLNLLNSALKKNYKISTKIGGYGTRAYQINFSNTSFYDFLVNIGLTSSKSLSIGALQVPDIMYSNFLRGYFDGDGTIYGYTDKRWKNSEMYYSSFASGSIEYLTWVRANNTRLFGMSPGRIHKGVRVYNLTYAKKDSQKLFQHMYNDNPVYKLERKFVRWIDFFNRDSYSYNDIYARVAESVDAPA